MTKPLLDVESLSVTFHQERRAIKAVDGISFSIDRGETVALVGESGSGKSVTALATVGLLPANAVVEGSVKFDDSEMVGAGFSKLRKVRGNRISFVFQEPMTSLNPLHTLEKQIGEMLRVHQDLSTSEIRSRTIELLEKTGIEDPAKRLKCHPHQFSGGQRQRIMIAMALANSPSLLIADEPTTALDVTIQAQILDLLAELQKQEHMAMLFITHDLNIVRRIADRVCVMQAGRIVESDSCRRIFSMPQHSYTKLLLAAEPTGRPDEVPSDAVTVVEATDVRVWFPIKRGMLKRTVSHVRAVNSANISMRRGETVGIVGESGSGKTTLALAITRLVSCKGSISIGGRELNGLRSDRLRPYRRNMQIVFQDPYGSLSPRMTVEQIVSEGLRIHERLSRRQGRNRAIQVLEEVGLSEDMLNRYPHEFSGGQRQRIAIARSMILRPKIVVLDEPTSALDRTVQAQIVDLLLSLQRKHGISYLFISHDLRIVRSLAHHIIVMKDGDIVESGTADSVFEKPRAGYTKALMRASFDLSSS
ncbi:MAG: ABC transporter ATP-binding protein [Rhodobacteraceae bacterium]|nr:ABC transporter ATP-binding protein [Paracoccaceae bacterium]